MEESPVDIQTLVNQAKAGNPDAFGKLYDHFIDAIYRFVYFRVGTREDTEDITELIFMNAFTHVGDYRDNGVPFQAWLYKIARNKVIDYYRTKKSHTSLDEAIEIADDTSAVEDIVATRMTYERVKLVLMKLPETYREIIILKFIEEKENEEISEIMEKPVAHIRVLQNRAIGKLRLLLNHE